MRIAVTGASGLIGSALVRALTGHGHEVTRFVRSPNPGPGEAGWDPGGAAARAGRIDTAIDLEALARQDAVAHVSGRNLAVPLWTPKVKREILESRTISTRLLASAMATVGSGPRTLVKMSAIGYYGSRGDEILTEASSPGDGFLADVVRQWEQAARPAEQAGIRVVQLRTGVVLSPDGGALALQLPLFKLGLGGRIGSGRQWVSWTTLHDVCGIFEHAIETDSIAGPLNATAPHPVTNRELTDTLARRVGRPAVLAVPGILPRLAGEAARETLLASQRALPKATEASGYRFRHADLEHALADVLVGKAKPSS